MLLVPHLRTVTLTRTLALTQTYPRLTRTLTLTLALILTLSQTPRLNPNLNPHPNPLLSEARVAFDRLDAFFREEEMADLRQVNLEAQRPKIEVAPLHSPFLFFLSLTLFLQ